MSVKKGWKLNNRLVLAFVLLAGLIGTVNLSRASRANQSTSVAGEPIASGDLLDPVSVSFEVEDPETGLKIRRKVKGIDLTRYTVAPGGSFGWHLHSEPGWVIIVSGTLTYHDGNDPSCTPVSYQTGSAFLDPGNHAHNARNDGKEDLVLYTVFMRPEGGSRQVDIPPGNCELMKGIWEPTIVRRKLGR